MNNSKPIVLAVLYLAWVIFAVNYAPFTTNYFLRALSVCSCMTLGLILGENYKVYNRGLAAGTVFQVFSRLMEMVYILMCCNLWFWGDWLLKGYEFQKLFVILPTVTVGFIFGLKSERY